MTDPALRDLHPPDAVAALRSFPRRLREVVAAAAIGLDGEPDPAALDEMAARVGPDGRSALDLVVIASRSIAALDRALHQALVVDDVVINADVLDPATRAVDSSHAGEIDVEVDLLALELQALADHVAAAPADRWLRPVRTTGNATVTALDVAREAVRTGRAVISDVERTLRAVRGRG